MNKQVFHRYCLILVRLSVFATVFPVLSSCGGGSGEFYMSPCFPLPDSWCSTVPPDTTPPTTPTNLVALSASPSRIDLSWGDSKDIDSAGHDHYVSGYKVYKDGIFFANAYGATNSSTVSYSVELLAPTTQYCFTVSAYDSAGNESGKSITACATTQSDTEAPTAPTNLHALAYSTDIILSWGASTDDGHVAGYQIYRDGAFIGTAINETFRDTGLINDKQYCYTVQAVDTAAKKSAQSNEACATTSWKISEAIPYGYPAWTSIALDANGNAHIAYYDIHYDYSTYKDTGAVYYATNLSGSGPWQSWLVGKTNPGFLESSLYGSIALQVNTDGARHVAYYDPSQSLLQHWMWSSSLLTTEAIATDALDITTVAMALDGTGKLHVVANPSGVVTYMTNTAGNWSSFVVGNTNVYYNSVLTCAIAADDAGKAYIGYYDYSSQSLKFVSNASGTWVTATVDNTADVGMYTSIAVDAGGQAHISYYDNTNGDLKYGSNVSGFWSAQTIDSAGDVGPYSAIALDGDGHAYISYIDATRHILKYATNKSGSWATYIITSGISNGCDSSYYGNTSIAVDWLGKVHISYLGNGPLCYATNR